MKWWIISTPLTVPGPVSANLAQKASEGHSVAVLEQGPLTVMALAVPAGTREQAIIAAAPQLIRAAKTLGGVLPADGNFQARPAPFLPG